MIIWGIRKHSIYSDIDHSIQCPHCSDKEEGVELEVSRKHLRIFWIPTLAFRKKLSLRCLNCGSKIKVQSLRDSEQVRLINLKGRHRAPLWQFSGLFVVAIFIAIMIPVIQNSNAADLEKIKHPEMGYYLRYRVPGGGYSSY
ncbi:hypothetical protein [Croceimicrobium hydrocarbonivorans]|uniref:Zinc-ribbon 15 domain-containing protein n=1 Tax=Croceimicrobium hydrocarbonivorans TaxID=2761580 RepID=A0A7H0VDL6_9FLAO|nr:hypothetical protein [Croceimicrobium hydrocarbonivorans]QNR23814.1 hypothetical protein H4K34_15770 [Croceimicrobium hydrocarbonivorans]